MNDVNSSTINSLRSIRRAGRPNLPFNTRTCRTTKEINSLMAAGGID